jgi:hypothetical protein
MADDIVSLSGEGLKFGRSPANGELLIGNGSGFNLSTLTAGSNVTITNSSGGISINSTNSGGTVTNVTGTAPITSTGGATPNIALTTPVAAQYGGTGLATITANSLVAGNGTGAVNLIAPGSNGNVLTSNGTTWASLAPTWNRVVKTSNQTANTLAYVDDSQLAFSVSANKIYVFRVVSFVLTATTGIKIAVNGPASPSFLRFGLNQLQVNTSSYDSSPGGTTLTDNSVQVTIPVAGTITTGGTAGTVVIRWSNNGTTAPATIYANSYLEWALVG